MSYTFRIPQSYGGMVPAEARCVLVPRGVQIHQEEPQLTSGLGQCLEGGKGPGLKSTKTHVHQLIDSRKRVTKSNPVASRLATSVRDPGSMPSSPGCSCRSRRWGEWGHSWPQTL